MLNCKKNRIKYDNENERIGFIFIIYKNVAKDNMLKIMKR